MVLHELYGVHGVGRVGQRPEELAVRRYSPVNSYGGGPILGDDQPEIWVMGRLPDPRPAHPQMHRRFVEVDALFVLHHELHQLVNKGSLLGQSG